MANEIGSASNLEDLFGKIVSFLTTNASLVAEGREWEVMRLRRDNILSVSTDLSLSATQGVTDLKSLMRYDSRMINTDNPGVSGVYLGIYASAFTNGKHITMQLRSAKSVRSVVLRSQPDGNSSASPRSFVLQYSDDGLNFTTCHSSSTFTMASSERRLVATGNNGTHAHWRILFTNATTIFTLNELLLLDENGEVANQFGSEVIFRSKGISGTDNIYTGIRTQYSESAGWYNLFFNGFTGYSSIEPSWFAQPGSIPGFGQSSAKSVPMIAAWDSAMPYWFSATGSAFKMALKVSTVYSGGYLGFINAYSTPSQYPYPLAVGGSMAPDTNNRSVTWRYSHTSSNHSVFANPGSKSAQSTGLEQSATTLYLRNTSGTWASFSNRPAYGTDSDDETMGTLATTTSPPYSFTSITNIIRGVWPYINHNNYLPIDNCFGGGYTVDHCELYQIQPSLLIFGALDGIYAISGSNNASENTTVVNGKNAVIFQNTYRTAMGEYWALTLD